MALKAFKDLRVLSDRPASSHSETLKRTKERYDRRNSKKRIYSHGMLAGRLRLTYSCNR